MAKFNLHKFSQAGSMIANNPKIEGALDTVTQKGITESALSSDPAYLDPSFESQDNLLINPEEVSNEEGIDTVSVPLFDNHVEMYEKLKSMNSGDIKSSMDAAWNNYFAKSIGDTDVADDFKGGLSQFFEVDSESEESVDIANKLFDIYSKIHPPRNRDDDSATAKDMDLATASTMAIVKIAQEMARSNSPRSVNSSSFNLSKTAQHKKLDTSVILTGPSQTSLSPFTRDIQSGLHLIEQNKGFGLKIDDILDIDFEAIWRGNIMDKYTSPYRDESGNEVGGYINRRFEVNRNIPVGNNLQLLPGTRHRPWMPEYSTIESRMEMQRGNKEKLSDPFSFAKTSIGPFNLKKKK